MFLSRAFDGVKIERQDLVGLASSSAAELFGVLLGLSKLLSVLIDLTAQVRDLPEHCPGL